MDVKALIILKTPLRMELLVHEQNDPHTAPPEVSSRFATHLVAPVLTLFFSNAAGFRVDSFWVGSKFLVSGTDSLCGQGCYQGLVKLYKCVLSSYHCTLKE